MREHYRALGTPDRDDRRRPRPRRGRGRPRRRPCARWSSRDPAQVAPRARAHGGRRLGRGAHARAAARARAPGRDDRRARSRGRGVHPRQGGVPTFKGYHGFPASICASPNDMVVHGIPGAYALQRGRRPLGRRRRHAARLGRRFRLHVLGRRGRAARGRASPAHGLPRFALRRRRAVRRRPPPLRPRARRADARRGRRLRRDPLARRPRRGAADARGSADPELRPARARARCCARA